MLTRRLRGAAQVKVEGPGPVRVSTVAGADGVHALNYVATVAGTYSITATVGDAHLRGSPASVTASTARACSELCEVVGAPLTLRAAAGVAAPFRVAAKDATGTQKSVGGDVFAVSWAPLADKEARAAGKVVDDGNGEYGCQFQAVASGTYQVSVTHSGAHVAGSPFTAVVEPQGVHPGACTAVGDALAGQLRCNRRASLIVKPADEYHNPITTPPLLGSEVGPPLRPAICAPHTHQPPPSPLDGLGDMMDKWTKLHITVPYNL